MDPESSTGSQLAGGNGVKGGGLGEKGAWTQIGEGDGREGHSLSRTMSQMDS